MDDTIQELRLIDFPCDGCDYYAISNREAISIVILCGDHVVEVCTFDSVDDIPNTSDNDIIDNYREQRELELIESGKKLSPKQKSKKNLSNACFVLAIMFCLTIVGIPIGVIFFVLAAKVAPDLDELDSD